jgi:dienelactone hydrolase
VEIGLAGFTPQGVVTIHAQMQDDDDQLWKSHATFRADAQGHVDVATQAPLSGTYTEADATGLFWSMRPETTAEAAPFAKSGLAPTVMTFTAAVDGQPQATATLERLFVAPAVRAEHVRSQGLAGTLFRPAGVGPHPGVVVLGGSGGGLPQGLAALLASHGYAALALAYFSYEHLPAELVTIPLEYFETGMRWLQAQQGVRDDRLGVVGTSRGGELALLLGATFPQVTAVVGYVPSGIVWGGITDGEPRSAWTYRGTPLPFAPELSAAEMDEIYRQEPIPLTPTFLACLQNPAVGEAETIPVERTRGAILLISGQDDQMWPSTLLSDMMIARLRRHAHPHPYEHVSYAGAGHDIARPYLPTTVRQDRHPFDGRLFAYGGNPRDHAAAQAASWAQVLSFLGEHLGSA